MTPVKLLAGESMNRFATIALWLFIINLGIALGAGLYEGRINVPRWIGDGGWNPDAARADNTGLQFWVYVTTVPLTLLTLINFVIAWTTSSPLRTWLFAATIPALLDRALTFGYFIPRMVRLMDMADSPTAREMATQWQQLNHLRHVLLLTALLAAIQALVTAAQLSRTG